MNPRLVKEADALFDASYDIRVIACQWQPWAVDGDRALLSTRRWRSEFIDWSRERSSLLFWYSRVRHNFFKRFVSRHFMRSGIVERALERAATELTSAVTAEAADLFIGHTIGALSPVIAAGQKYNARVAYDAEDFDTGMHPFGAPLSKEERLVEFIERRDLAKCDYISAASPSIAAALGTKYGIQAPVPILNVFPLSQRPVRFGPTVRDKPLRLYWFSQWIGPHRGLEDAIQAMGLVRQYGIEFHVRGNWVRGYREEFFKAVAKAGIDPKQIVEHEPGPPDEMSRLASTYDIGLAVEPARDLNNDLTVSNKMFTYMLAGNAIIATATKGQQAIMGENPEIGFCYKPGDVEALAARLELWNNDRDAMENTRRTSWKWGAEKYNWDLEKERFLQLVGNTLNKKG